MISRGQLNTPNSVRMSQARLASSLNYVFIENYGIDLAF